jgi:hypothetical protein
MALALEKMDGISRLVLRILSHLGGSPLKYYRVFLCWFLLFYPWMFITVNRNAVNLLFFQLPQL